MNMNKNLSAGFVVVLELVLAVPAVAGDVVIPNPLPDPGPETGVTDRPVKVYILSGQSNMVGMGRIYGTEPGTLQTITQAGMFPNMVDSLGNWTVRNDVMYKGVITAVGQGPLTPGVQQGGTTFGPEMQFGHVMGYYHDEPVLLLKVSQGNRSLAWDILPPGSERYTVNGVTYAGYGDLDDHWSDTDPYTPVPGWYAGKQYDDYVSEAHNVLDNFGTLFPQYKNQGYEIAGFVWWQGHKDSQNAVHASRYELNLVNFIKSFRGEFNAPDAPFVLGTIGFYGWAMSGNYLTVANAQLAVSGETGKYPEFADNVKTVETRDYWRTASESPNPNQDYHYYQNAETYMRVGEALGRAMADMQVDRPFVTVDQQTGEIKIVNPSYGDIDMVLRNYSITSATGGVDATNWTPIAGNYDLAGDGSVDSDGNWTVLTGTNADLSEHADAGGDGLIAISTEVSLGVGAWVQNPVKDLRFTYTDANGVSKELSIRYVGTPIGLADLNFDGTISGIDWPIFLSGSQRDLSALSAAEAYQMGDLDGDGDNDIYDFALFREAFEAMNPAAGAFEAMVASYAPEPGSALLLAAGAAGLGLRRRRRARTARERRSRKPGGGVRRKSMVAGCSGRSLLSMAAAAMAAVTFTAASANAATMTNSPTAPTIDGQDIASYGTTTGSDKWWPDVATSFGNPGKTVGQTFTTGSQGVRLNAITFQVTSGTQPTKTYAIRVGVVSGTTFETFASESATQGFVTANNDYWTWTLDTPVFLFPNTVYGVDVGLLTSSSAWQTGIPYVYYTADVYPGGTRFRTGTAGYGIGDTSMTAMSGDRIFHLDLTAAAPPLLTLRADPVTGATSILGDPTRANDINYYEITSVGHSLDSVNWASLADQDFEGSGPPNGTGNGWEEAGGVGKHALAEAFLLGNSTIGASQSVSLGSGYDAFVGAEDLVFTYRTDTGAIIEGLVEYISSVIPGDANWDGVVDAADYIALKRNFGMATGARYQDGDFNGDHDVDWNDLQTLMGNFGARSVGGAPAAPEPATLGLLALGALSLPKRGALALIRRGSRVR